MPAALVPRERFPVTRRASDRFLIAWGTGSSQDPSLPVGFAANLYSAPRREDGREPGPIERPEAARPLPST